MDRAARRVAWTSAFIHGLVHACVLLLPPLLADIRREFGVSLLDVLAAANVMYLLFGAIAIPAGYLADRVGSRGMLVLASAGCAASTAVLALAPNFMVFGVALGALGLFAGLYHPSGLSLLSRSIASGERGRAIGIHGVGGNFGEAIAPAIAALLAARLGWRTGYLVVGAIALVSMLLAASLSSDDVGAPAEAGVLRAPSNRRKWNPLGALTSFWRSRPLRWLLVSAVAGGFVYRGVLTFLPLHLTDGATDGSRVGAYLTSLVLVAGMAAQRFGGELADRLPRERLLLAEVAIFAPLLLLLGIASGAGLVALALGFGFLWYLAQPLAGALTAAYADAGDHGLLYGIQFALSFGLGSFATTAGGLLVAQGGTGLAFLGFGAVGILQLVAVIALVRSVRAAAGARAAAAAAVPMR